MRWLSWVCSDPEDAESEEAHQVDEQARGEGEQDAAEVVLAVHGFGSGNFQVEHEQGHGDGEDAVAEGSEAFDALSGDLVVGGGHG
ncbi:MAG TPA: hypothetical protein VF214_08100 [Edaphobacter sp.]